MIVILTVEEIKIMAYLPEKPVSLTFLQAPVHRWKQSVETTWDLAEIKLDHQGPEAQWSVSSSLGLGTFLIATLRLWRPWDGPLSPAAGGWDLSSCTPVLGQEGEPAWSYFHRNAFINQLMCGSSDRGEHHNQMGLLVFFTSKLP